MSGIAVGSNGYIPVARNPLLIFVMDSDLLKAGVQIDPNLAFVITRSGCILQYFNTSVSQ